MKNRKLKAAFRAMEQPIHEAFHGFELQQQQMAATLPLEPLDDSPLTLKVAEAIKPTDSPGTLIDNLLGNRDVQSNPDVISLITFDGDMKATVKVFPASTDMAAVVDGAAVKVNTIVRDDATSENSAHTATPAAGHGDDILNTAVLPQLFVAQKPARSLASLVNAIVDVCKKQAFDISTLRFVHSTVGDGKLEIYTGALGTGDGTIAAVAQDAAPAAGVKATRW